MFQEVCEKVKQDHLERMAFLYIRQSTLRQVVENSESTKRQYDLQRRAIALGWQKDQITVIDCDLGESGASTTREGFKRLVSEVGLGNVGIVMGLEVSRLARNSTDWHRLLEICALTNTLILDEEGIYHPSEFNDRLLLGLKGTMSEAELHLIRARMQGGMLNKAKRGELKTRLPIGFVHNPNDQIVLDPEVRVRDSINLLFQTYGRVGTATCTVKEFKRAGLKFPKRIHCGPRRGEVVFCTLTPSRVFQVLKNPRYAGAYVYGLRQQKYRGLDKAPTIKAVERSKWKSFIKDAFPGYITWDQFEENAKRMQDNSTCNAKTRKCVPREGPALLQGIACCGICGKAMTVRYHARRGTSLSPDYSCRDSVQQTYCQNIPGQALDKLIESVLLENISVSSMNIALSVQDELQNRIKDADKLRFAHVEKSKYEMELAKRRYLAVEPENRLVAETLESEWNSKIKDYHAIQAEYERKTKEEVSLITQESREKILALVSNFPHLWKSSTTTDRDRKRMVRLLISDVTLTKSDHLKVQIKFKGGATAEHIIPLAKSAMEERRHPAVVISEIDRLLNEHSEAQVAKILNKKGFLSGTGKKFDANRICVIRRAYGIPGFYNRLRDRGFMTAAELGRKYNMERFAVRRWIQSGKMEFHKYDKKRYLYKPLENEAKNNSNRRGAV